MTSRRTIVAIIMVATAGIAAAQSGSDGLSEFQLQPLAGFEQRRIEKGPASVNILIRSTTGKPRQVNASLCSILFTARQGAHPTPQQVAAEFRSAAWRAEVRAEIGRTFPILSEAAVSENRLDGIEFIARTPEADDAARAVLFVVPSTKGRAVFACAIPADDLETSLPILRKIRRATTIPR